MDIRSSAHFEYSDIYLAALKEAWDAHPLRDQVDEERLGPVVLDLEQGGEFGINFDQYPRVVLHVPEELETDHRCLLATLSHELTHLIDRHDPDFAGHLSPPEITSCICELPHDPDTYQSVRHAFITYWNIYIDGRLSRRGIVVKSFPCRLYEKTGTTRWGRGLFCADEVKSVCGVWESESLSFPDLVQRARQFPYHRPVE